MESVPELEHAAKACWPDLVYRAFDNGVNPSLAGLLAPYTYTPRDIWWTFARYAQIVGRRLSVAPSGDFNGIAGYEASSRTTRILLGNKSLNRGIGGTCSLSLQNMSALGYGNGSSAHVTIEKIPSDLRTSWLSTASAPVTIVDQNYTITGNGLMLSLPDFGSSDAFTVTIR
jgi:hypothetical protein